MIDPVMQEISKEMMLSAASELDRMRSQLQRIVDHYASCDELYTNDADVAAGMADIARLALAS